MTQQEFRKIWPYWKRYNYWRDAFNGARSNGAKWAYALEYAARVRRVIPECRDTHAALLGMCCRERRQQADLLAGEP